MRFAACAVGLGLLVSVSAFAQDAPPPPPIVAPPADVPAQPAPPPQPPAIAAPPAIVAETPPAPATAPAPAWNTIMKEELLVDTYYMYTFTGNLEGNKSQSPVRGRNYDILTNSFTLSYAKFALEVDADPVTVRADLGYGTLAALIAGGSPGSSLFAAQQAYASLKVPGTQLSIDMGRFNTTAGAEVIEANRNWIYSRSMLFAVIPVTHTGLRLNLKVNDQVSVQASVVNGIANDQPDGNAAKTGGLSVSFAPLPTTSIVATTYFGKEGPQGAMSDPVHFTADLVVSHNVSDQFGLNLNIDYIKGAFATGTTAATAGSSSSNLIGAALMARFVANEHLNLAARGEFLKDKGIYLDPDGQEYELTATVGIPFAGHLEIRAELRADLAKNAVYLQGDEANPKKSQVTGTVAFLGFI